MATRGTGKTKVSQKENLSMPQKTETVENRAQKRPRTVLGSITNNARVQPPRAAKYLGDARQDENLQKVFGRSSNQPFSIYVDQNPPQSQPQEQPVLEQPEDMLDLDAVASLPTTSQPVRSEDAAASEMSIVEVDEEDEEEHDVNMEPAGALTPQNRYAIQNQHATTVDVAEVTEYASDIYRYLLAIENNRKPQRGFMRRQQDVTVAMRSILVDWLVEVAEEYRLQRETLFLTVNFIDRFLADMSVLRSKLQLVGATAMFLAAKYEEIYPPDVNEFVYITDDTYQRKQILRMEVVLLKSLDFRMGIPTINWFSERLLTAMRADDTESNLTMYLCELVLVDYENFMDYPSSVVAASAFYLARHTTQRPTVWTSQCVRLSYYTAAQLRLCVHEMYDMHCNAASHPQQAVREKYRLPKYDRVADLPHQPRPSL